MPNLKKIGHTAPFNAKNFWAQDARVGITAMEYIYFDSIVGKLVDTSIVSKIEVEIMWLTGFEKFSNASRII